MIIVVLVVVASIVAISGISNIVKYIVKKYIRRRRHTLATYY